MRDPSGDGNSAVTIALLRGATEFLKAHAETFLELVRCVEKSSVKCLQRSMKQIRAMK
ncbi:hypothetical protein H6F89_23635 [Cyanobacteria bacterium FACHB-63]|nr:hypothetical protein [Cyanobacteria bacterium FACHB-63]